MAAIKENRVKYKTIPAATQLLSNVAFLVLQSNTAKTGHLTESTFGSFMFPRSKVLAVINDPSDSLTFVGEDARVCSIPLPVFPFQHYHGEFFARSFPDDTWEISHRDSHGSALLCRSPLVPGPCGQQWQVAHSLCSGVATFSELHDAESYVVTLLRLSARQAGDAGICKAAIEHATAGRD